jgi:hypothetical protein
VARNAHNIETTSSSGSRPARSISARTAATSWAICAGVDATVWYPDP